MTQSRNEGGALPVAVVPSMPAELACSKQKWSAASTRLIIEQ
ncbi:MULTISPECIES: hypothetical protein [Nitrosomonas]|nr:MULTISPECIES: hypothetical protein [Nitrosomonas]